MQTSQPRCTQHRNKVIPPCFISHYQRTNPTDFLLLHTSVHNTCCFDFLPLCLSTQLMASLPAWVIRAECINLVFIYSPWIQHVGNSSSFWQSTLSLLALSVKSRDLFMTSILWSWENSSGGDCSLYKWIGSFSALDPCLRLPCSLLKGLPNCSCQ